MFYLFGLAVFLGFFVVNLPRGFGIAFVTDYQKVNIGQCVLLDLYCQSRYLSHPKVLDILEALLLGDVVDYNDRVRSLVVGTCDGPEPFLTSGVPNLQFDDVSLNRERSDYGRCT